VLLHFESYDLNLYNSFTTQHLYVLYFVLDILFLFSFTRHCAFIIPSPQLLSCKCVFIKLLCSVFLK